jgi:hypothetical protein
MAALKNRDLDRVALIRAEVAVMWHDFNVGSQEGKILKAR